MGGLLAKPPGIVPTAVPTGRGPLACTGGSLDGCLQSHFEPEGNIFTQSSQELQSLRCFWVKQPQTERGQGRVKSPASRLACPKVQQHASCPLHPWGKHSFPFRAASWYHQQPRAGALWQTWHNQLPTGRFCEGPGITHSRDRGSVTVQYSRQPRAKAP